MNRNRLIDTIRGLTLISMIGFHLCWDLMYFDMGVEASFLFGPQAYVWQQSICWTFIFISGYCFSFGHHHLKRGLMALGGGILISVVTTFVIPDERDIFGVLWLIGSSILIMIPIDILCQRYKQVSFYVFGVVSVLLFFITRNINDGYLGFEGLNLLRLPTGLYKGYVMTYLGFLAPDFYSSDYFSLIPWFFLFAVGYCAQKFMSKVKWPTDISKFGIKPLEFLGRHAMLIYMLHQVILYGLVYSVYSLVHR